MVRDIVEKALFYRDGDKTFDTEAFCGSKDRRRVYSAA